MAWEKSTHTEPGPIHLSIYLLSKVGESHRATPTSHTEAWKCHFQASAARRYPTWLCLSQRRRATSRRKKVKTQLSRACTILFCAMSAVSDKSPGKLVLPGCFQLLSFSDVPHPKSRRTAGETTAQWQTWQSKQMLRQDWTALRAVRPCRCRLVEWGFYCVHSVQPLILNGWPILCLCKWNVNKVDLLISQLANKLWQAGWTSC